MSEYKLVSREFQAEDTVIGVNGIKIGGKGIVVMAGPCAIESKEQITIIAKAVAAGGAVILRGGAFKPRTSPYSFQGLGNAGLVMLAGVGKIVGLPVITEVMDPADVKQVAKLTDIIQIGSRSMSNYPLLKAVGRARIPVLLKRDMAATIEEWLFAAEYILNEGNQNVILCERGIRTFETVTRNTLDINAVPLLKRLTHLPVIVDPSHGTGRRDLVVPVAKAAIAAGADGLLVEVHHDPANAKSDGAQSLLPEQFSRLMRELRPVAEAVGRELLQLQPNV